MLGQSFTLLALMAVATATTSLADVDPNTLKCDPEGQVFLLLPHFTDCSKFFMCVHGKEVEFSCSGSLIFDFILQTCNWEWAVECKLRTPLDNDSSGELVEGSGDDEGSGWLDVTAENTIGLELARDAMQEEVSHFAAILDCNSADSAVRQVPYKGDCQRYWRCVKGQPVTVYCSDGLFFNAQTEQCDFEANAKCTDQLQDELQGEYIVYN